MYTISLLKTTKILTKDIKKSKYMERHPMFMEKKTRHCSDISASKHKDSIRPQSKPALLRSSK